MRAVAGKVALITGGGTGIGRGIALAWTQRGGAALLVGRRLEPIQQTAQDITQRGGDAWAIQVDITNASERDDLKRAALSQVAMVEVLVHSAGVMAGGAFTSLTSGMVEQAIATNLAAPVLLTHEWLPLLQTHCGGIIVVGSLLSNVALPGASLYGASKGALHVWARALRAELARYGVHVLLVHPPGTRTAMTAGLARALGNRARLLSPERVGERIVRAWEEERRELAWGGVERFPAWLSRIAPGLFGDIVRWQAPRLERFFGRQS